MLPSPDSITALTSAAKPLALGVAALAGLVAAFGPSTYPLIPAILGYEVAVAEDRPAAVYRALFIVAGMVVVGAAIGAFAGALGLAVARWIADRLALSYIVTALVMLVLGLRFLRLLRFPVPGLTPREANGAGGAWESLLLGMSFGVAACPACTPLMLAVVLGAVAVGKVGFGAAMLACFAIGRGIPIMLVASVGGAFRGLRPGIRWAKRMDAIGGTLLIASAVYFGYQAWSIWHGSPSMGSM